MPKLKLSREQLAAFLPDHQSIRAFEQLFDDVEVTIPDAGNEANTNAGIAIAAANAAIAIAYELLSQVSQLLNAPAFQQNLPVDDFAPRVEYGTITYQNSDAVTITGGAIDGTPIGQVAAASGGFTSLSYSNQLTSTVVTGTAPMIVTSTTKVANLNVDLLDGGDWSSPGAIGTVTPNSGTFTALSSTGGGVFGNGTLSNQTLFRGPNSGVNGGVGAVVQNGGVGIIGIGNKSAILGGAYDATPLVYSNAETEFTNSIRVPGGAYVIRTTTALTNGAGAGAGTITNAPAAGNPTKWIGINDNGTIRYIPAW